jgi:hypothetical protein
MRHKPKPKPLAYAMLIDGTCATKKEAQSVARKLKRFGIETYLTLIDLDEDLVEEEKP